MNVFVKDRLRGTTRIVSLGRDDAPDRNAQTFDVSDDGQVVAWDTRSPMGDPEDTNGGLDVYAVDLRVDAIPRRVSVTSDGSPQDSSNASRFLGGSNSLTVSGDGTRVAVHSYSTNVVPGDSNGVVDVFLRDLATGVTVRASTSSTGRQGNGDSYWPSLSHDGRTLVFDSESDNLVDGDTNGVPDSFVHDLAGV